MTAAAPGGHPAARVLVHTGKGGVGRSTIAAATLTTWFDAGATPTRFATA